MKKKLQPTLLNPLRRLTRNNFLLKGGLVLEFAYGSINILQYTLHCVHVNGVLPAETLETRRVRLEGRSHLVLHHLTEQSLDTLQAILKTGFRIQVKMFKK